MSAIEKAALSLAGELVEAGVDTCGELQDLCDANQVLIDCAAAHGVDIWHDGDDWGTANAIIDQAEQMARRIREQEIWANRPVDSTARG